MVAVGGLGGQHRFRAVGKDRVVAVDRERFGLSGRHGGRVEPADPAHDQSGGDVLGAAAAGELLARPPPNAEPPIVRRRVSRLLRLRCR